ncbi:MULTISPECIES: hypothetical protein [unclassified Shewanella]|uniref:hypothetical protein n=1 Tax=unclassified Shewanella TaxID=196818 RepID=UPI00354D9C00
MFSTNLEDILFYADTIISKIVISDCNCVVYYEGWDDKKSTLTFNHSKIIYNTIDPDGERVETGQLIKLKNNRMRIVLFDDENKIFLELEYDQCHSI